MLIITTCDGDKVYRYQKSIVAFFNGKRKVLSTSIFQGGYHEDYSSIFNHDATCGAGMPCKLLADTYYDHMYLVAQNLGINPLKTTGMGTAAQMENAAIKSLRFKDITVSAIVTGGIETNGGRAGDPANFYKPLEKDLKPGTINIMLFVNCDLPESTMVRALVTCTEAKTAAIEELMAGSNYSTGLATGSGTDQTIIVANSESPIYLEGAGKHAKLGELIGRTVKAAVKEALNVQSGLNAQSQHNVLARLKRFGISRDTCWRSYEAMRGKEALIKPEFLAKLEEICTREETFPHYIGLIHIYDEWMWGLISEKETIESINTILQALAAKKEQKPQVLLKNTLLESFQDTLNNFLASMVYTA